MVVPEGLGVVDGGVRVDVPAVLVREREDTLPLADGARGVLEARLVEGAVADVLRGEALLGVQLGLVELVVLLAEARDELGAEPAQTSAAKSGAPLGDARKKSHKNSR